jgi:hypothetical protein
MASTNRASGSLPPVAASPSLGSRPNESWVPHIPDLIHLPSDFSSILRSTRPTSLSSRALDPEVTLKFSPRPMDFVRRSTGSSSIESCSNLPIYGRHRNYTNDHIDISPPVSAPAMTMTFQFHPKETHDMMPYGYHKSPLRASMFSSIFRRDGVSNNRKPNDSTKATFGKRFGALMKKGLGLP